MSLSGYGALLSLTLLFPMASAVNPIYQVPAEETSERVYSFQEETESVLSGTWTITESPAHGEEAPTDTTDDDPTGLDIRYLLFLQDFRNSINDAWTPFMEFVSTFATHYLILAVLFIYWAVNKRSGLYTIAGMCLTLGLNQLVKLTACVYRPWIRDPRVVPAGNAIVTATGYSFPSGHTMNAASVYGGGVMRAEFSRALRGMLLVMVLFVAFSRMFVGVHTPQDVLVGTVAGMTVMWLTVKLMKWVDAHPGKDLYVVCIGIGLALAVALYAWLKPYPADFDEAGKLIVDGAKMANDTFKGVGWCSAFLLGWILERRFIGFTTDVPFEQKMARGVIGLMSYYAVSLILVPMIKGWISGPAGTLISCFFQMFFVAFLFPWCMVRIEKKAVPVQS